MSISGEIPKAVPTERYYSEEFLKKEKKKVFNHSWVMACLSSSISLPDSYFVFEYMDRSILITRDQDAKVHAFVNACLHRGTKLLIGSGNAKKIVCPYHAWSYDSKGELKHIPCSKGMKNEHRTKLIELPCHEVAGFVWISFEEPKKDIFASLGRIHTHLLPYRLEEMVPIQSRNFTFDVNWKISMENALDYYHVPKVHTRTVNAHVKNPPTFTAFGDHNLQTLHIAPYSWRSKLDAHCARGGPYTRHQMESLHKFFVFPNLVINVLPYHLTVMQLWPVSPTRSIMNYQFCYRTRPSILEKGRAYLSWLASRLILYEDAKLYPRIQKGMETCEMDFQPLHQQELSIAHFHGRLSEWVGENQAAKDKKAGASGDK